MDLVLPGCYVVSMRWFCWEFSAILPEMPVLRPKQAIHVIWNLQLSFTNEIWSGGREEAGKVFRSNEIRQSLQCLPNESIFSHKLVFLQEWTGLYQPLDYMGELAQNFNFGALSEPEALVNGVWKTWSFNECSLGGSLRIHTHFCNLVHMLSL